MHEQAAAALLALRMHALIMMTSRSRLKHKLKSFECMQMIDDEKTSSSSRKRRTCFMRCLKRKI